MTNVIPLHNEEQPLTQAQQKVFSDALRIPTPDGFPQHGDAILARMLINEVADIRPHLDSDQYATFIGVISILMSQAMGNVPESVL